MNWTKCEDAMPPEKERVLCRTADGRTIIAWRYQWPRGYLNGWNSVYALENTTITHWHPLPAPPEEKN